jgi:hypothetical protein
MLSSENLAALAGAICATAETLGQTISGAAAQLMAEDLAEHDPVDIRRALQACRRELTGKLTLAAILQRIQASDGRPGKDEAWSIALEAADESATVVMTAEILQAMTAAHPVLDLGDKVGARMAFLSAYERLVTLARAEAVPATWSVSLGFDPARRVTAIESAVRMQLISQQAGAQYLSDLRVAPITTDGQAIAGLLTGKVVQPSPKLREKLAEVRLIVTAAKARQDREKLKKAQADRVDTYLRKRQTRAAIAAMQKELTHV